MTLDDKLRIVGQGNNGIGLVFFAAPNLIGNLATTRSIVTTKLSIRLTNPWTHLLCGFWCGIIHIFMGGLNFGRFLATIVIMYFELNTHLECGVH